jgi:hypothetical protein
MPLLVREPPDSFARQPMADHSTLLPSAAKEVGGHLPHSSMKLYTHDWRKSIK